MSEQHDRAAIIVIPALDDLLVAYDLVESICGPNPMERMPDSALEAELRELVHTFMLRWQTATNTLKTLDPEQQRRLILRLAHLRLRCGILDRCLSLPRHTPKTLETARRKESKSQSHARRAIADEMMVMRAVVHADASAGADAAMPGATEIQIRKAHVLKALQSAKVRGASMSSRSISETLKAIGMKISPRTIDDYRKDWSEFDNSRGASEGRKRTIRPADPGMVSDRHGFQVKPRQLRN